MSNLLLNEPENRQCNGVGPLVECYEDISANGDGFGSAVDNGSHKARSLGKIDESDNVRQIGRASCRERV